MAVQPSTSASSGTRRRSRSVSIMPRRSAGAAAANLGAVAAERGICESGERLVELRELCGDAQHALVRLEPAVDQRDLSRERVEPLEHGLELTVAEFSPVHDSRF